MKERFTLSILRLLVTLTTTLTGLTASGGTLSDRIDFAAASAGALMSPRGWAITAVRNGGWGRFPQHYSYRVVEVDAGDPAAVGSYDPAQKHGHGAAIPIDWDGDPRNGLTALSPGRPVTVSIGVSVFIQPYAKGRECAGTWQVAWGFGPGIHAADTEPQRAAKDRPIDWTTGRGPRLQYRLGYDLAERDIVQPEFLGYAPAQNAPATAAHQPGPAGAWYDLRLEITIDPDEGRAACAGRVRPRDGAWQEAGNWSFTLAEEGPANPAAWNALLLDQSAGQWSRQGYGEADDSMRDRYDNFAVEVTASDLPDAGATLFAFERLILGASLQGKSTLFRNETPSWRWRLVNGDNKPVSGQLALRLAQDVRPFGKTTLAPGKSAHGQFEIEPPPPGESSAELLLDDGVVASAPLTILAQRRPQPSENVLRNAGFELDRAWNGGPMRQGGEFEQAQRQYHRKELAELPVEAWWAEAREATGVELTPTAHSGARALRVTGPASIISALDPYVPAGPVTLSAWVQAKGAAGSLELLLPDGKPAATVNLPDSDGWQRVSVSATCPDLRRAVVRLRVTEGTVIIDDVQIQSADRASEFALRPAESLRLALADHDPADLPRWVTGDVTPRTVTVHHDTPSPSLTGPIRVWLGSWDEPKRQMLGELSSEQLPADLEFSAADLRPNAYILTVSTGGLDGADAFDPTVPIEGKVSTSMTAARTVLRIAIAPDTQPAELFGVGNYMLHTGGSWYGGTPMADYAHAGRLGMVSSCGPDYNLAAGGLLGWKKGPWPETKPPQGAPFVNPAASKLIDIYHPDGWAFMMARAEQEGRRMAVNPFAAAYKMRNERLYAMDGKACPSEHADAAFREWCRDRHGDLATLNQRWGVEYTDWSEVEQVMSANRFHLAKEQPERKGAAAVDWTASTGHFGPEGVRYMRAHPGQAMDWMRWRTESGLRLWREFRKHARKFDAKTLYSNNLCWPNFWPQMFMPFVRDMDVVMLDCQYTAGSGLPRGLGTPHEMIEILEMAESIDRTKPVWGLEIYVQPRWPAEFTALQNWAMVAHGMRNNQVFGWRPYSDSGRPKGNRAWENGDNRPMWFMIDNDGTHLPNYHANARSIREINRFHQRFNGLSLRRHPTDIAVYVSSDTAEFVIMDTGNRPYDSMWCHTRNNVAYLLRMEGITADYVDDDALPAAPGRFRTLIVPAAPVLSQAAAERLAAFAKAGGTVVLAGICGQRDPWLRPYEDLGGPAWHDLQWKADEFTTDERGFFMRGKHPGTMREALPIFDTAGLITGWQRPWGKGRLIASAVFPAAYTGSPHATQAMLDWIRKLIKLAELPFTGRWRGDAPPTGPETEREKGTPVVEVVVRPADNGDRFVFVLNQGGSGSGVVEVPLPDGRRWRARDVFTDKSVRARVKDRLWSWHIELAPWEYRVIRLHR